ncbi:MAG: hypothetical protein SGJ01_10045 [Gemmatimonadota bacterium]|nr:hypothetical protein [Gemmatimonadota bacterium]
MSGRDRLLGAVALSVMLAGGVEARTVPTPKALTLADQARRELALIYAAHSTELLGCLIGELRGDTVLIERIAPADVDPAHSTPTHVLPRGNCEQAGWTKTVGMIHNHPDGKECWYLIPGTRVPGSDGESFLRGAYAIDAILCGERLVWINREMLEREVPLVRHPEGPD